MDGLSYKRQPGDYQAPRDRTDLCGMAGDGIEPNEIRVSGTSYYVERFRHLPEGKPVEAELVPEPGHWADPEAVCVDLNGIKVGYLSRLTARQWQEIIREANRQGHRVTTKVRRETYFEPINKVDIPGLKIMLPSFRSWRTLHEQLGFEPAFQSFMSALPVEVREALKWAGWAEFNRPELIGTLFQYRQHLESDEWERVIRATHQVVLPGRLEGRLRSDGAMWVEERDRIRQRDKKVREAEERESDRRWEEDLQRVRALAAQGWTQKRMAEELEGTPHYVRQLIKELRRLDLEAAKEERSRTRKLKRQ
ncbi:hypothetical protein [Nocardia tengchongensis]|uniref:hypothetical protein n=1 Tax=Nocardia tengchongensis TaxID=2055889 RepID=UPI00368CA18A